LQEKIKEIVFTDIDDDEVEDKKVYAYRWRYDIYSRYSIVHAVRLNGENALSRENFETYLISNLFPDNEVDLSTMNVNLDLFDK
jgi:hypothetical protein